MLTSGARPPLDRLSAMRDALGHRGPDDSGIETIENVGLVHTRLSIVDLTKAAHQPMCDEKTGWWLSFNGEIFNHREIRSQLGVLSAASDGDTATLLAALVRRGVDVLPELNGQFAFAAIDPHGRKLILSRDRFGIKPLYVAVTTDGVWFASEPAALHAAGVHLAPRPDAWESIVRGSCYGGANALLSNVTRLAPGSCLLIDLDDGLTELRRWYEPVFDVDPLWQELLAGRMRSELITLLEETLRSAVHDVLLGDAPIGTLLSGGLDSSLIAALAREAQPDLIAFGARWRGDPASDEGPAARRSAAALGLELDLIEVTEQGWRRGFVPASMHFGLPLANASSVPIAQMAERARSFGIKVLLTGEGADELFCGYGSLHAEHLRGFLSPLARMVRAIESHVGGSGLRSTARASRRDPRPLGSPSLSGPTWKALSTADAPNRSIDAYTHHSGPRRTCEVALLDQLDYTLSHLLNRMDTNMMQASVEARVPFLDPRVVRLALNLPLEARVEPWSKGILRDTARRVLPWRVAHRPKLYGMDFAAGHWIERAASPGFLAHGLLRDALQISSDELR